MSYSVNKDIGNNLLPVIGFINICRVNKVMFFPSPILVVIGIHLSISLQNNSITYRRI